MPLVNEVHVDAVLSQFSLGYRNSGYIADLLFPALPVVKESDKYAIFSTEAYRRHSTLTADKAPAKRGEFGWTSATYSGQMYKFANAISRRERENADNFMQLQRRTVERTTDTVLLDREMIAAAMAVDDAVFPHDDSPTTKWDAGSGQTPIKDVLAGKEAFRLQSLGLEPNLMVLPPRVLYALKSCAAIIDQVKYTSDGLVTLDLLRRLFEMERIIVPRVMYDSTQEGDTASVRDLWGDTVGLYYLDPQLGQEIRTMGLAFRSRPMQTRTWQEPEIECDVYEVSMVEDMKVIDANCGYLLLDVLT